MVLIQVMLGVLLKTREVDTHLMNSNCMAAFKTRGVTFSDDINFSAHYIEGLESPSDALPPLIEDKSPPDPT